MGIGNVRLEEFIVEFLNLLIERFVIASIFGGSKHHGQNSARLKKRQDLRIRDLLGDPLDRGRRIDQVVFLFSEIMGDEVVIHDMEIWKVSVLFFHFPVEMFPQFDRVILTSGAKDRVRRLSGSRTDL